MICSTCDSEMTELWVSGAILPIIGTVCGRCAAKLIQPTTLEGCVEGPSIAALALADAEEFERRRAKRIRQAREVCGGDK